jgi:hypothetical protein
MWTTRTEPLLRILLTPCALAFVAALFGFSIIPALLIGLASSIAADAYYIATLSKQGIPLDMAIRYAVDRTLLPTLVFGMSWLTAWWWGMFLRVMWSRPEQLLASNGGMNIDPDEPSRRRTLKERMLSRCASAPMGFFIVTLLANVYLAFIVVVVTQYGK